MIHSIDEVMRRVRGISHEETRRESEDYLEMVMFKNTLPDVEGLFLNYFGPALKPAGREACEEAERLSNGHGGVSKEQILFHANRENSNQMAMIWPWADGKRMTVKILQECP